MDIEFLWWEGCPSTERALAELRSAVGEVGLDPSMIRIREIKTDADGLEAGFMGSPTVLIDGEDVGGSDPVEGSALSCRVYRQRNGTISPTPDPDDLREALMRAAVAR